LINLDFLNFEEN